MAATDELHKLILDALADVDEAQRALRLAQEFGALAHGGSDVTPW